MRLKFVILGLLIIADIYFIMYGKPIWMLNANSNHEDMADKSPEFSWIGFDGVKHSLKELDGKPVIIHFWASWCGPCREEFPKLLAAAQQVDKDTIFLTISSDKQESKAKEFVKKMEVESGLKTPANMMHAVDPERAVTYDIFQTVGYPETILMDKNHIMRHKFVGMVDWEDPALLNKIKLLKN